MSQLADKLRQIKKFSGNDNTEQRHKPQHRSRVQRFPDLNSYQADGVDHINIGNTAKTQLGQMLSNNYIFNFNHPVLGSFKTIEGYWNYLKTNDDRFRYATKNVKDLSQAIKGRNLKGFRFLVLEGIFHKLSMLRPKLIEELEKYKGIPLDIYYEHQVGQNKDSINYILIRVPYFEWFLGGLPEVISAVVENREPNLNRYMDRMTREEIYSQFIKVHQRPVAQEVEAPITLEEPPVEVEVEVPVAEDIASVSEEITESSGEVEFAQEDKKEAV